MHKMYELVMRCIPGLGTGLSVVLEELVMVLHAFSLFSEYEQEQDWPAVVDNQVQIQRFLL